MVPTYVVGAIDNYEWPQIENWWRSLKLVGFAGEIHLLVYRASIETLRAIDRAGIVVHERQKRHEQVVIDRFFDVVRVVERFHRDAWVVFPDVGDIVFQYDPVRFLDNITNRSINIVVASEGIRFSGNRWVRDNLRESLPEYVDTLSDELLYNAGSLAARARVLAPLAYAVHSMCITRPAARSHDQAVLNLMLRHPHYHEQTLFANATDEWCYCGASSMFATPEDRANYLDPMPSVVHGYCVLPGGQMPCMFHHYTRGRHVKRMVQKRLDREWQRSNITL
jgi:hypothetical protein